MKTNQMGPRVSLVLLAFAVGAGAAVCGLLTALRVTGPALRRVLGNPVDFNQDYASHESFLQALIAQGLSIGATFFLVGFVSSVWRAKAEPRMGFWAANPLTVGVGYWVYRTLELPKGPAEYFAYLGWALLSLLSPLVFAPCVILGGRFGLRRKGAGGNGDAI